jgi:hypothetical protein
VTVYAQKRQPDVPDRAEPGGLRVVHIPVGAAGKRGDAELLARVPAFSDPLRARWRRERPDVVYAVSWTSGFPALMATRDLGIPVVQAFSSLGVAERRDHASADPATPPQPGSGWSWPWAGSYRPRRSSHQDGPAPRRQGPAVHVRPQLLIQRLAMCPHRPPCPPADRSDRDAAHTIAFHPEQGWSLLCNGVILFDDTGGLLPDGRAVPPHHPARIRRPVAA